MLRQKEVCEMLKITKPTLYKWVENGLKSYKVDGLVFFEEEDIKEFIKRGDLKCKK